jgi:nucleotide-binding universal stress UspA family protein
MIPEIGKILYATDLSENARHAFGYAASLANRYGATIVILHVLEDISPSSNEHLAAMLGEDRWKELQARKRAEVLATIESRLAAFCDDEKAKLATCPFVVSDILVRTGTPASEILEQARKMRADVIVMGTHGRGTFAEAMLGSTARRVVRRSETPVLVIRLPQA